MTLELLSITPERPKNPVPLLFVHGAYCSAQIWTPFFLPFFADHGYATHAVSLRGHGKSEGRQRLSTTHLRDYVADLATVAARLETEPVLIGWSMGGLVVQRYIHDHDAHAAVLLASAPPHGMLSGMLNMAICNPILATDMMLVQTLGPRMATMAGIRQAFFRPNTPDEYIKAHFPSAEPESHVAVLDMLGLDFPASKNPRDIPVLVLGGEQDSSVTRSAVEGTARSYGTTAEMFPGMPHAMMLDRDWEQVARRILGWLDETLPQ